jgi:hypothetical protein
VEKSTTTHYGNVFNAFQKFCRLHQFSSIPLNVLALSAYVSHLHTKRRRLTTVYQYISGIRSHAQALGHPRRLGSEAESELSSVLKGYRNSLPNMTPSVRLTRIGFRAISVLAIVDGLPARRSSAVRAITDFGLTDIRTRELCSVWREDIVLCFLYFYMLRSATLWGCASQHVARNADALCFRECITKTRRVMAADARIIPIPWALLGIVGAELNDYVTSAPCHARSIGFLTWESVPKQSGASHFFSHFVRSSLARVDDFAPMGFIYSSHSCRISAASSANAIGTAGWTLAARGGWKDPLMMKPYINGLAFPSPADWTIWGFLVPLRPV